MRRLRAAVQGYLSDGPANVGVDVGVMLTVAGVGLLWGWQWAVLVTGLIVLLMASGVIALLLGRLGP